MAIRAFETSGSSASNAAISPATRKRAVNLRRTVPNKKAPPPKKKSPPPKPNSSKTKRPVIPQNIRKSAKFNKLVERLWRNAGAIGNAAFQNEWNKARTKAFNIIENRIARGVPPFTPSPPKAPKKSSPPKAHNLNYKFSPQSGRVKIKAPNSGRYVYANGGSVTLEYLKSLASRLQVNIKGLRSKKEIVNKIFGNGK